jgi:hypothetical protein
MLKTQYAQLCRTPSDINQHLPTLAKYASECTHITECGVRAAVSSYAFAVGLDSKPNAKIVQVDPNWDPNIGTFQKTCAEEGLQTVFYEQSDLECPLEETDLLFIDTWHVYGQLKRELARWHMYVRKYIIMHDTKVDELYGETIRNGWDAEKQSRESGIPVAEIRKGLLFAVNEFLAEHPDWVVHAHFTNNNGLTVLTRYNAS